MTKNSFRSSLAKILLIFLSAIACLVTVFLFRIWGARKNTGGSSFSDSSKCKLSNFKRANIWRWFIWKWFYSDLKNDYMARQVKLLKAAVAIYSLVENPYDSYDYDELVNDYLPKIIKKIKKTQSK